MDNKTRKFDGNEYRPYIFFASKRSADASSKRLKDSGYLVRTTKGKNNGKPVYNMWLRMTDESFAKRKTGICKRRK
jgi:hypothetical protein